MMKKLVLSLMLAATAMATLPVAASAEWEQTYGQKWAWEEEGIKAKGWQEVEGYWYYFDNSGQMTTGWFQDNGNWYYCWSNGQMACDTWLWNGGYWYYFDQSGKLVLDSVKGATREYYFDQPGIIISKNFGEVTTGSSIKYESDVDTETTTGASVAYK